MRSEDLETDRVLHFFFDDFMTVDALDKVELTISNIQVERLK